MATSGYSVESGHKPKACFLVFYFSVQTVTSSTNQKIVKNHNCIEAKFLVLWIDVATSSGKHFDFPSACRSQVFVSQDATDHSLHPGATGEHINGPQLHILNVFVLSCL